MMHAAHERARVERVDLTSYFTAHGAVQSTRLIGAVVGSLNKIHEEFVTSAMRASHDLAIRMNVEAAVITAMARPHLENASNVLLGVIPPAGFPDEAQRYRAQYHAVFQQRIDGALRDLEIGFIGGQSIPATESRTGSPTQQNAKEVLTLKPSFWGIGIDLKELWHRVAKHINHWRKP